MLCTFGAIVSADWIEPYNANSRNTLYMQKLYVNEITSADNGYASVARDEWTNLAAKSSQTYVSAVPIVVLASTLNSGTTLWASLALQNDVPRTVGVQWCVTFATNAFIAPITVTGYDARYQAISEVIVATCSVMTYGNYAFNKITSVLIGQCTHYGLGGSDGGGNSPELGWDGTGKMGLFIGTGDKIGLLKDVDSSTDVKVALVNTGGVIADEVAALTINATYDTWTLTDVPDGADDYTLIYTPVFP